MRNPSGWQSVLRVSPDGTRALAVLHSFAVPSGPATVTLPGGRWTVLGALAHSRAPLSLAGPHLRWQSPPPWSGAVALLQREP
jgi:alpha-galactosidase